MAGRWRGVVGEGFYLTTLAQSNRDLGPSRHPSDPPLLPCSQLPIAFLSLSIPFPAGRAAAGEVDPNPNKPR